MMAYDSNVYIINSNGIYKQFVNDTNWNLLITDSTLTGPLLKYGDYFFAGTINGVYYFKSDGVGMTAFNEGMGNLKINTLAVNGSYLFAGNDSQNVWRRPLSDFIAGIKENTLNNSISIYPNPTKDNLTIETNLNTKQKVDIINLFGQTVYTTYIYNKTTINTSPFANGVYILKLSSDKESVVRKFVKE